MGYNYNKQVTPPDLRDGIVTGLEVFVTLQVSMYLICTENAKKINTVHFSRL
jgi:hypothetical protein